VAVTAFSVDLQFVPRVWDEEELSKMVDGGIPYYIVVDAAGHLGTAYGVYDAKAGVDVKGRFIIDPDGSCRPWRCSRLRSGVSSPRPCARSRHSSTHGRPVEPRSRRPAGSRATSRRLLQ
jgi:alkyl hydroperoxide reductase subunit AhpC